MSAQLTWQSYENRQKYAEDECEEHEQKTTLVERVKSHRYRSFGSRKLEKQLLIPQTFSSNSYTFLPTCQNSGPVRYLKIRSVNDQVSAGCHDLANSIWCLEYQDLPFFHKNSNKKSFQFSLTTTREKIDNFEGKGFVWGRKSDYDANVSRENSDVNTEVSQPDVMVNRWKFKFNSSLIHDRVVIALISKYFQISAISRS